jgi:ABC-type uncharacterized transport system permease subunit
VARRLANDYRSCCATCAAGDEQFSVFRYGFQGFAWQNLAHLQSSAALISTVFFALLRSASFALALVSTKHEMSPAMKRPGMFILKNNNPRG